MEISLILNNKQIFEKSINKLTVLKVVVILLLIISNPAFKTVPNILRI